MADDFAGRGRAILPVDDKDALMRIQAATAAIAAGKLDRPAPSDAMAFLDGIHTMVSVDRLNDLRLSVMDGLNAEPWFRPAYFALARRTIEFLVGNELCMQRRINLSIQLPNDESSLLATHADVWSGDSPFEVVVWLPLVDCFATKSMYLCPPAADAEMRDRLAGLTSAEAIFREIEPKLEWLSVRFGEVLVFDQTLMHGNRINREPETRWTMNCRFKSVLSPYADKKLGEFFEPITLRPVTRRAMRYRYPGGYR
jgi:sporadic carbohydrate cluster 2OG-Fe(II) oxygenase